MESDLQQHHHYLHDHQLQHHQRQTNSSLTRYQSAPSTFFSNFLDTEFCEDFLKGSSPETERIFSKYLSGSSEQSPGISRQQYPVTEKMVEPSQSGQSALPPSSNQQINFPPASQGFYQSQPPQNVQNQNTLSSEMDYRAMSSVGVDRFRPPMKMSGSGNSSNLIRHSSSPAGLFNNISIENGMLLLDFFVWLTIHSLENKNFKH